MAYKNFDIKKEYTESKGGDKKKNIKKFHKKDNRDREESRKREEIVNEVDSDWFEIVGTKEKRNSNKEKNIEKNMDTKKRLGKKIKIQDWKEKKMKEKKIRWRREKGRPKGTQRRRKRKSWRKERRRRKRRKIRERRKRRKRIKERERREGRKEREGRKKRKKRKKR